MVSGMHAMYIVTHSAMVVFISFSFSSWVWSLHYEICQTAAGFWLKIGHTIQITTISIDSHRVMLEWKMSSKLFTSRRMIGIYIANEKDKTFDGNVNGFARILWQTKSISLYFTCELRWLWWRWRNIWIDAHTIITFENWNWNWDWVVVPWKNCARNWSVKVINFYQHQS